MTRKPLLLGVICNVTPYPMSKSCMIEKLVSWCTRDRLWRDIGGLRPSVGSGAYGCALARSRADIWRPCICNHHGYWNSNCSHLIRNKKYWFEAMKRPTFYADIVSVYLGMETVSDLRIRWYLRRPVRLPRVWSLRDKYSGRTQARSHTGRNKARLSVKSSN